MVADSGDNFGPETDKLVTDFFYQYGLSLAKDQVGLQTPFNFAFFEFEVGLAEGTVHRPPP